jgi:nucleoredoxin
MRFLIAAICLSVAAIGWVTLAPTPVPAPSPVATAPAGSAPQADPASANTGPLTGFPAQFDHQLVSVQDGHFNDFDAATLRNVKYFAFYYSASWCPPCRAFTPKLVDFYNDFKSKHPDFELIFVNHDQNEEDMLSYMTNDRMPWPAVRFADIDGTNANKFCGDGIPDLVLVNANGDVLSDSFNGSQYVGPYKVLDDIQAIVK